MVPQLMRPHEVGEESGNGRPPVVKDCDLEQFDRLELSGGGWAQPTPDVDYTERLVFSDEEDSGTNAGRCEFIRIRIIIIIIIKNHCYSC